MVDKILFRLSKYGLNLKGFANVETKEEEKKLEDEIYERLLREMKVKKEEN